MNKIIISGILALLVSNLSAKNITVEEAHHKGKVIGYGVASGIMLKSKVSYENYTISTNVNECNKTIGNLGLINNNKDMDLAIKYCIAILKVQE
jgi:hypothetical protein